MQFRSLLSHIAVMIVAALSGSSLSLAAEQSSAVPAWLQAHVGTGEGRIAAVVLQRARALYLQKTKEGAVDNPCYFAMDATRPSSSPRGGLGRRFYIICEAEKSFRAISSGYGNGRKLRRANFSNGRRCAKNFSNAEGSNLTAGGVYITAETRESFKGILSPIGQEDAFRSRVLAVCWGRRHSERLGPGHRRTSGRWFETAVPLQESRKPLCGRGGVCSFRKTGELHQRPQQRLHNLVAIKFREIIAMVQDNPTTLYIYPESGDIDAVAKAVKDRKSLSRAGLYWNIACLRAIGAPKFWPKETLQPIIDEWRDSLPKGPPRPLPICKRG